MKVAVIPWNDEWRGRIIFSARDYADKVLVITSFDKINAIYLGLKKVKEMGCKPLVILEDLSKDEKILISSLLKDAEFIIGSKYINKVWR